ncbi:chitin synthase-domain-containing protein [Dipodascopsis tothii]|uniref:chitin synthase-domain-containing protein n=1 Tax=Dipodascopsis tothii TaxID=44089 RepID=UPI0034CD95C9
MTTPGVPLSSLATTPTAPMLVQTVVDAFRAQTVVRIDSTSLIHCDPLDFDDAILASIWEHARRRNEDQTILVSPMAADTRVPASFLGAVAGAFLNVPPRLAAAVTALEPFISTVAADGTRNLANAGVNLAVGLDQDGGCVSAAMALRNSPAGYPWPATLASPFDGQLPSVFLYLFLAASEEERALISLAAPAHYAVLQTAQIAALAASSELAAAARHWRATLETSGFGPDVVGEIFATLSGILLVTNDGMDDLLEGSTLMGVDPACFRSQLSKNTVVSSAFAQLTMVIVAKLNEFLAADSPTLNGSAGSDEDPVAVVNMVFGSHDMRAGLLKSVLSDENGCGLGFEMIQDGVPVPRTPEIVLQTISQDLAAAGAVSPTVDVLAVAPQPGFAIGSYIDPESLLAPAKLGYLSLFTFEALLQSSRTWNIIYNDLLNGRRALDDATLARRLQSDLESWQVVEWVRRRRTTDYTTDMPMDEFLYRYSAVLADDGFTFNQLEPQRSVGNWAYMIRGWSAQNVFCGSTGVWLSEDAWRTLEGQRDGLEFAGPGLPEPNASVYGNQNHLSDDSFGAATLLNDPDMSMMPDTASMKASEYYQTRRVGDDEVEDLTMLGSGYAANDPEVGGRRVEIEERTRTRKVWVAVVWMMTFWIPSFLLSWVGRMKRPDVRMAWREKVTICVFILLMNASIIFYMIFLGNIICPEYNKVWNAREVSEHTATNDFYVSIHGKVYDISKFWRLQHSDNGYDTTSTNMVDFAGLDLSNYFPPPLTVACPSLVKDSSIWLLDNTTVTYSYALHACGPYEQTSNDTALYNITWYDDIFLPKIKSYYKGELVVTKSALQTQGSAGYNDWAVIDGKIYDLTNYFYSYNTNANASYQFLNSDVTDLFTANPGEDITELFYQLPESTRQPTFECLEAAFYAGKVDMRKSARCMASNWILLAIAVAMGLVILVKFFAAIRFGNKANPTLQDKFVICQIPAYTEGEDQLRNAIDSLTSLKYDNKRKLLFIICDGMIIGSGNDEPTPKIVLDILGAESHIDPPALPFKSVGEGSAQLNYGKVYSGLYEFDGNVVPYVVVVKVGKPTEKSKPGNRGKRDSQCLLLHFLNRVHNRGPMSPLELEIFHQINNVVGVDPELYEYILMVDADTTVSEDSLNRLVAQCANDARIAGIAGETSLQNQEDSWWTMIQVYEYYIAHHLSKSFESLFGSVTCLPGCFSMYRIRSSDKGKPLIISDKVLNDYSDGRVNTLHKKNLLSLGEDRFLTTIMVKHFPKMKYVFDYSAKAQTAAPETWSVLLSQRRRWINSTIHNLTELMFLPDLCGFFIFNMKIVILIDLVGTLVLPSVMVYLVYLLYVVISHTSAFPLITVIMLAAIYGLQMLIFLFKRQWQHFGWMIIYLLAYPVYSFILPIYSFWNQDNFSWGNTRIVVGERGNKQIVAVEDEPFDEGMIPTQTWELYSSINNLPGQKRPALVLQNNFGGRPKSSYNPMLGDQSYELHDIEMQRNSTVYPESNYGYAASHASLAPSHLHPSVMAPSALSRPVSQAGYSRPVSQTAYSRPVSQTAYARPASQLSQPMNRPPSSALYGTQTPQQPLTLLQQHQLAQLQQQQLQAQMQQMQAQMQAQMQQTPDQSQAAMYSTTPQPGQNKNNGQYGYQ